MAILGLDIHKQKSTVAVLSEDPTDDDLIDKYTVRNNTIGDVAEQYAGGKAALEATGNYFAIYDTLDEQMEVVLANPLKLSWITEAKTKTDKIDAEKLAVLLKTGHLPESYVPPMPIRHRRELVRARYRLQSTRKQWKNRVHSLLDRHGILPESAVFSEEGRQFLEKLSLDGEGEYLLANAVATIDEATEKLDEIDRRIASIARDVPDVNLLVSTPGIGPVRGLTIHAELGEVDRFSDQEALVSYAGMDPTVHQSADTRKSGSMSKQGSPYLREAVISAAHTAVHAAKEPYLSNYYWKLRDGRDKHPLTARCATGRKLLESLYFMLTREEKWNPPT